MARYIEMDFSENTTRKAMAIKRSKELTALLGKPEDVTVGESSSMSLLCIKFNTLSQLVEGLLYTLPYTIFYLPICVVPLRRVWML